MGHRCQLADGETRYAREVQPILPFSKVGEKIKNKKRHDWHRVGEYGGPNRCRGDVLWVGLTF